MIPLSTHRSINKPLPHAGTARTLHFMTVTTPIHFPVCLIAGGQIIRPKMRGAAALYLRLMRPIKLIEHHCFNDVV